MRFEVSNPYTDTFGVRIAKFIQTNGVSGIGYPIRGKRNLSKLVCGIEYDRLRHVFYFRRDLEFRRCYYDASSMYLRNFIRWFIREMPRLFMAAESRQIIRFVRDTKRVRHD